MTLNWNLMVGLLSLLVALWVVMWFIPELFVQLFYTNLGMGILVLLVAMAFYHNKIFGAGLGAVFIALHRFAYLAGR